MFTYLPWNRWTTICDANVKSQHTRYIWRKLNEYLFAFRQIHQTYKIRSWIWVMLNNNNIIMILLFIKKKKARTATSQYCGRKVFRQSKTTGKLNDTHSARTPTAINILAKNNIWHLYGPYGWKDLRFFLFSKQSKFVLPLT